MPLVTQSFADCIARPTDHGREFLLSDHLAAVAAGCGDITGEPSERLAFLAGLCHDVAKATAGWQRYIRLSDHVRKREAHVPHSPLGAAIFAFLADRCIPLWAASDSGTRRALNDLAADWTRVIYDHHGRIRDLEAEPPWRASFASEELVDLLATCDLPGIAKFLAGFNSDLVSDLAMFQKWLARYDQAWARRLRNDRPELIRVLISSSKDDGASNYATAALRLPALAAVLVRADRYHAGELGESYLAIKQAGGAIAHLRRFCAEAAAQALGKGADAGLVAVRGSLQEQVASQYREHRSQTFFTLSLPTGYGKTFSGVLQDWRHAGSAGARA